MVITPNLLTISDILPETHGIILGSDPVPNPSGPMIDNDRTRNRSPVLVYSNPERHLAMTSLWNSIGKLHKAVEKTAGKERAALAVHGHLYKSSGFLSGAYKELTAIEQFRGMELPNQTQLEYMKSHHVTTYEIARFMCAQAITSGERVKADSPHWVETARSLPDNEFVTFLMDAISAHRERIRFWSGEFRSVTTHPAVVNLLERIRNSHA